MGGDCPGPFPTSPLTSTVTLQFSSLVIPAIFDIIHAVPIVASHDNNRQLLSNFHRLSYSRHIWHNSCRSHRRQSWQQNHHSFWDQRFRQFWYCQWLALTIEADLGCWRHGFLKTEERYCWPGGNWVRRLHVVRDAPQPFLRFERGAAKMSWTDGSQEKPLQANDCEPNHVSVSKMQHKIYNLWVQWLHVIRDASQPFLGFERGAAIRVKKNRCKQMIVNQTCLFQKCNTKFTIYLTQLTQFSIL